MPSQDAKLAARSAGALIGGLFAILFVSSTLRSVLGAIDPHWNSVEEDPHLAILLTLIGIAGVSSIIGGYFAATVAPQKRIQHALVVAALVFILAAASAMFGVNRNPLWYSIVSTFLPASLVVLGARAQAAYPLISNWR